MTHAEITALVEQYCAGLEAEMMLLHRLQELAIEQRRASQTGSVSEFQAIIDSRDRIMATLVTVEHELKGVRHQLVAARHWLSDLPAFHDLAARHKEATDLVADILSVDRDSLEALKEAEGARHLTARSIEQGESTLAPQRRGQPGPRRDRGVRR